MLFQLLFFDPTLCMSDKARLAFGKIGDWFFLGHKTYIKIYGSTKLPHLFPKPIPDKFSLQEVAYQTLVNGVGAPLAKDKKLSWPTKTFCLGSFSFKDTKKAQVEADILATFQLLMIF
jgi:hypothetical protein